MFTRNSIVLSNNIKTPLTAISRAIGNILQLTYGQLVKQLFSNQEQGFAYDPNDLTTLYQDAAGNVPVTAAGQPVGLMLDKSKGLRYGSELISGGNFESGLIGTKTDESGSVSTWELNTVNPISGTSDGLLTIATAGNFRPVLRFNRTSQTVVGKVYEVTFDYKVVSGSVSIGLATATASMFNRNLSGNGRIKLVYVATSGGTTESFYFTGSVGAVQIDNVSSREIIGNHAYQSVSASRPILQQTAILGNELITNGDFSNGTIGWGGVYGGVLSTQNGNLVITSDGTSEFSSVFQQCGFVSGKRYKISFKVVDATQSAGAYGFVSANNTGSVNRILTSSKISSNGFYESEFTASSDTKYITIGAGAGGMIAGEAIYFDDVSVREVTGYRTDQNYLAFDGVDDFLQTNSIDFTATDKVSLFAGVRKLSDTSQGMIAELSSGNAVGSFMLHCGGGSGSEAYTFGSRGSSTGYSYSILTKSVYPMLAAPKSSVITSEGTISTDLSKIKVDRTYSSYNPSIDQGTGNYGSYPLYIGRRGGFSLPFNGHLYSLIGIGRLTTDSETIALEKAIAKNTGVTLNV